MSGGGSAGQGTAAQKLPADAAALPSVLRRLDDEAEAFVRAAKAPATLRAYRSDWSHFRGSCEQHALSPLPASAETVALYLTALAATHRPATMTRRLTAITKAHGIAGHPSPATMAHALVSETLKGIRRTLGTAQATRAPLLTADVRRMVEALPDTAAVRRDQALLLLGFAGGFRRSELAALECDDVQPTDDGLVVALRRSKTDPEGKGRMVGIPCGSAPGTCPVRALRAWRTGAEISEGALFRAVNRHGHVAAAGLHKGSVGLTLKRAAAGLDPAHYASHSLRAGLATQAWLNGAGELAIMRQTGHRSLAIVRRHIRDGSLFRDNPAAKPGFIASGLSCRTSLVRQQRLEGTLPSLKLFTRKEFQDGCGVRQFRYVQYLRNLAFLPASDQDCSTTCSPFFFWRPAEGAAPFSFHP